MSCPDANALVAFVRDQLADDARAELAAHIDGCARCTETLATAASLAGDTAEASPSVPGTRIGRFVVEDVLGEGAMGVVVRARDTELDRVVAIKLVSPSVDGSTSDDVLHERLRREAKAMAQLSHPNVITVHEVGSHGDHLYVVMELCAGGNLREWLVAQPRSQDQIIDCFRQAAHGLAAAHAAGLVHRDFKPDNVLVGADGRVRVADFGLVRSHKQASETLTQSGLILGSPAYMAPEQHLGKPATPAADQFGFCVALWEALSGRRPFSGSSYIELAMNVVDGKLQPLPSEARVPAHVHALLVKGLTVDASARWSSMAQIADALGGAAIAAAPAPSPKGTPWIPLAAVATIAVAAAAAALLIPGDDAKKSPADAAVASKPVPPPPADKNTANPNPWARANNNDEVIAKSKAQADRVIEQMKKLANPGPGAMTIEQVNKLIAEKAGFANQRPPAQWWKKLTPCPNFGSLRTSSRPKTIWCDRAGVKHGYYTRWHPGGNKAEEGAYNQGRRLGMWMRWHANGKPAWKAGYIFDQRRTDIVEWDSAGKIIKVTPVPQQ